jgi:predicted aspartyl protease
MQPYATMQIYIQDPSSSPSQKLFPLRLLVDTACSGFVLRPSVVQQKYRFLPSLSTPVTMTGAGGTASATGLTQIDRFTLDAADQETTAIKFGPLPAAVQDIGALPSSLDGIIGLSFLNQFAKVDFDFERGQLRLQKSIATATTTDEGLSLNDSNLVGRADLEIVPQLGIYTVDVSFDVDNQRRGPVKMLVDTGAANTFLSWKGVNDLGFSRDSSSSSMQTLDIASAAMGSDNVAMRLTHRLTVDEKMYIGSNATSRGLSLNSVNKAKALSIDIGEITLLEQLRFFGIGGILGIDALMRCSHVVLQLQGPKKTLSLYGP